MSTERVVIVGCGRRDCGDDGIGARIGEDLRRADLPRTRVRITESPGVELIADMEGVELFVIIDAAQATAGHPPGKWARIDYRDPSARLLPSGRGGTHGFSVAEALQLADHLGELPATVWVYAVFGGSFELGANPTAEVISAGDKVVEAICGDVTKFLGSPSCTS